MRKTLLLTLLLLYQGGFVFSLKDCSDLEAQYEDVKNEVRSSMETWELIPENSPQRIKFSEWLSGLLSKWVKLEASYNECVKNIANINQTIKRYFDIGNGYFSEGRWDIAIEQYKKIIELDNASYHAYYNAGSAYLNKKDYNNALEYYEHAQHYARGRYQIRESYWAIDKLQVKINKQREIEQAPSNDTFSHLQYYLKMLNVPAAWKKVTKSNEVVVAVIDDGININHPDLTNNIWVSPDAQYGANKIKNFAGDEIPDNFPTGEHGTMISGIIAAEIDNKKGIAGIAKNVKIMPLRVFDFKGNAREDNIIKAIRYAVDNKANIINLSLGQSQFTYSRRYDELMKYAYEKWVIVIIAAGNGDVLSYKNTGVNTTINPISPVCNNGWSKHYSLGIESLDKKWAKAPWSNYGACISFSAPGESIFSTSVSVFNKESGVDYRTDSGTSFSAPMIAGIIALGYNQYGYVSPDTVYASLNESVRLNSEWNSVVDAALYLDVLAQKQKIIQLEQNLMRLTGKNSAVSNEKLPSGMTEAQLAKLSDGDYLATFGYITKKPSLAAYKLQEYVLRQEVVALATRIGNVEMADYYQCRNIFADVSASKPNSWACRVIENAYDEWIVSKDSNYFGPEAKISLVEAVGMLLRAGDINIQKYSGGEIEPWKINIIGTAFNLGIVERDFDFSPDRSATRGVIFGIARKISELRESSF
jgi:subtilisin family serine protease